MIDDPRASIAATPPMGWNSWNAFGKQVNEQVICQTADTLVSSGLREAGYTYVVIDDHWHGGRDDHGVLFPDPIKFPSGVAALAEYVHARGLKFGIYSDAGEKTCGGEPGSLGFEEIDARTFASWGVDYLKYDFCFTQDDRATAERLYRKMGTALRQTGRAIFFSICEWGHHRPWLWGREAGGHMWRTTGDIWDGWRDGPHVTQNGIDSVGFEQQRGLEAYAGPGGWNDPDMLVVGLRGRGAIGGPGCTDVEYRTHFSLWCLLAAPLMIGCDLRSLDAASFEILSNPEMIVLDQDPLGKQGSRVCRLGRGEVWVKTLANGDLGVGAFNRDDVTKVVNIPWSDLEIEGKWHARDLWQHADLGVCEDLFSIELESHACCMLRLSSC
jgi:alpha-galactosidase